MSFYAYFMPSRVNTPIKGLDVWQEVLGVLQSIDRVSGVMSFRGLLVAVPPKELETLPDLEAYIGERVGLLRTDIPHRPLCVRLAKPENNNSATIGEEGRETEREVLN